MRKHTLWLEIMHAEPSPACRGHELMAATKRMNTQEVLGDLGTLQKEEKSLLVRSEEA